MRPMSINASTQQRLEEKAPIGPISKHALEKGRRMRGFRAIPRVKIEGKNTELAELQALAKRGGVEMLNQIFKLAKSAKSEQVRAMCAMAILDRAYGKPLATVEARVSVIDELAPGDREALLAGLQAMLGGKVIEGQATEVASAPPEFKPFSAP
jgi:hypothetical protein